MPIKKKNNNKNHESYDGIRRVIDEQNKLSNSKMNKNDWRNIIAILLVLIIFTFINFGGTNVPENAWESNSKDDYVMFKIPDNVNLGDLWVYYGIEDDVNSRVKVYTVNEFSTNKSDWTHVASKEGNDLINDGATMYRWLNVVDFDGENANYVVLCADRAGFRINEIAITNRENGERLYLEPVAGNELSRYNLTDEQQTFNGEYSLMNGMYFDEVYHARSAYEILNGMTIYEWTHPPLGKLLISLGIMVFGMNPFGWRIVGAIFSIASVLIMYMLGKRIFKKKLFATLLAMIFSMEGIRFTMGRIATLDVFVGFFALCSLYFMYQFFENGIDLKTSRSLFYSLVPFGLAGIFFGFAVAVKWTGLYLGLALLIMFIVVVVRTIKDYHYSHEAIKDGIGNRADNAKLKLFPIAIVLSILFGLVFYIVLPLITYAIPFKVFCREHPDWSFIQVFLNEQQRMWTYHTTLTASHPAQSPWWSWLLNAKGVFFYSGEEGLVNTMYSRIHCISLTAIAVYGVWAIAYFAIYLVKYIIKVKKQEVTPDEVAFYNHIKYPLWFAIVGYLGTLMPWAFISRSAFMYHYYLSMMNELILIILFLYVKTCLERKVAYNGELAILNGRKKIITYGYMKLIWCIALISLNFLLFYPALSGIRISKVAAMFMFGWANGWWGNGLAPNIFS